MHNTPPTPTNQPSIPHRNTAPRTSSSSSAHALHAARHAAQGEPVLGFTAQEAFEDCLPLLEGEFDRMRPEFLRHVVRRSRHLRAAPLGNGGVRAAMAALEGLRSGRMVADGDGGDGYVLCFGLVCFCSCTHPDSN